MTPKEWKKRPKNPSPYIGRPELPPAIPYVPPVRILVGVPAQDEVKTLFLVDLVGMLQYTSAQHPEWEIGLQVVQGTYLFAQRQELVQHALDWQATHILWLDSDMRFPEDALIRLKAHHVSIVGTAYSTRRAPFKLSGSPDATVQAALANPAGLVPSTFLGFGCLLTDTRIFSPRGVEQTPNTIPYPWFAFPYDPAMGFIGEDAGFAWLAKEAGLNVFMDPHLSHEIGHLGTWDYRLPDFRPPATPATMPAQAPTSPPEATTPPPEPPSSLILQ